VTVAVGLLGLSVEVVIYNRFRSIYFNIERKYRRTFNYQSDERPDIFGNRNHNTNILS
jgi:hypothetical protein